MACKKSMPLVEDFNSIPEETLVPEAEQPYLIPERWKWVRFSCLNKYRSLNIDPRKGHNSRFVLYSVPAFPFREPDLLDGKDIGSIKQVVESNDVLVCKINPRINRVWVVGSHPGESIIASSEWIVFRPSVGISYFYAAYFSSKYFRQKLVSEVSGVGGSLTRARPKLVDNYPVPLPPLDEQEAIVKRTKALLDSMGQATQIAKQASDNLVETREGLVAAALAGRFDDSA